MSLIARQDALVAQLQPVHAKKIAVGHGAGGWWGGTRSKLKRRHIDELIAAGYSRREAAESAQQCDEVAYRNADYDALMAQMEAAAPAPTAQQLIDSHRTGDHALSAEVEAARAAS